MEELSIRRLLRYIPVVHHKTGANIHLTPHKYWANAKSRHQCQEACFLMSMRLQNLKTVQFPKSSHGPTVPLRFIECFTGVAMKETNGHLYVTGTPEEIEQVACLLDFYHRMSNQRNKNPDIHAYMIHIKDHRCLPRLRSFRTLLQEKTGVVIVEKKDVAVGSFHFQCNPQQFMEIDFLVRLCLQHVSTYYYLPFTNHPIPLDFITTFGNVMLSVSKEGQKISITGTPEEQTLAIQLIEYYNGTHTKGS